MSLAMVSVSVRLPPDALAVVDVYREGVKARDGKLPTRSTAILTMIRGYAVGAGIKQRVVKYAEVIATQRHHAELLKALKADVSDLQNKM